MPAATDLRRLRRIGSMPAECARLVRHDRQRLWEWLEDCSTLTTTIGQPRDPRGLE